MQSAVLLMDRTWMPENGAVFASAGGTPKHERNKRKSTSNIWRNQGVYTDDGILIANVDGLKEAKKQFPGCVVRIKNQERER